MCDLLILISTQFIYSIVQQFDYGFKVLNLGFKKCCRLFQFMSVMINFTLEDLDFLLVVVHCLLISQYTIVIFIDFFFVLFYLLLVLLYLVLMIMPGYSLFWCIHQEGIHYVKEKKYLNIYILTGIHSQFTT
jgi:uncharacterized Tic20 family protein